MHHFVREGMTALVAVDKIDHLYQVDKLNEIYRPLCFWLAVVFPKLDRFSGRIELGGF